MFGGAERALSVRPACPDQFSVGAGRRNRTTAVESCGVCWSSSRSCSPAAIHDRNRPEGHSGASGAWRGLVERSGRFRELEERRFPNLQRLRREQLVTRTASISFVAAAAEDERERILDEVRAVARDLPAEVDLPYETAVLVADRLA